MSYHIFTRAQTSQQCVIVSFDTYRYECLGKLNILDIPILSFNISLDNPNLANLVSRDIIINTRSDVNITSDSDSDITTI